MDIQLLAACRYWQRTKKILRVFLPLLCVLAKDNTVRPSSSAERQRGRYSRNYFFLTSAHDTSPIGHEEENFFEGAKRVGQNRSILSREETSPEDGHQERTDHDGRERGRNSPPPLHRPPHPPDHRGDGRLRPTGHEQPDGDGLLQRGRIRRRQQQQRRHHRAAGRTGKTTH